MSGIVESISVLHVDDEPDVADLAAEMLEREDERIEVEAATDAAEGLDRLAGTEVDCVVSDYDMPGRNGIEFLSAVREEHPDLPFILYTGKGSEEVASDALTLGATDYLQKETGTDQYELLANRIANAVEQYQATRRAAELDRVRTLASNVNQALVRAASREAAETRVCEIISDADPYLFAWIGSVDPETDEIVPRASAGIEENYLDEVTLTADDSETGRGPGGTAVRDRRVAVAQDVQSDIDRDQWREQALERGYQAIAAIPLEHEDRLYGVLSVYADRPDAFDETERDLLAELGDDVAHTIHSFAVQEQLRTERDRRQALFENAPGPVIASEVHEDGDRIVMTGINDAFEETFGYDTEDVVGEDPADLVVPEDGREHHAEIRARAKRGEAVVTEVERVTADGPRAFLLHVIPYGMGEGGVDAAGADGVDGMYVWYTDISDRRERERAIRELHETTDELMGAGDAETVAEITVDAARDILDMPATAVYRHDEDENELVPVAWTATTESVVGEPPTFEPGEGIAWTVFETGEPQVYDDVSTVPERYNPDTPIRSQIVLPLDDHGVLLVGAPEADTFDDVAVSLADTLASHVTTVLDRIERERELRLMQQVVREMNDGAVIVQDGIVRYTNPAVSELLGYPSDELVDMAMGSFIAPEYRETVQRRHRARIAGDADDIPERYEIELLAADGSRVPVEIQVSRIEYEDRAATVSLVRDITERERRERELQRQNERLEEFASVVSHDLRNPLNIARGKLQLAREERDSERLAGVARAHERMESLIADLLTLARQGEQATTPEDVDLAETVHGCWATVRTAETPLRVETDRTIRADPGRLRQLLENLLRNAVDHGGDDVTVTVGDLEDGFYVADDGAGIPADDRDQVFEAGYSTAHDGTGFGLKIVREIATAHGWDVRVTDSETGGARFEVTGVEVVDG